MAPPHQDHARVYRSQSLVWCVHATMTALCYLGRSDY